MKVFINNIFNIRVFLIIGVSVLLAIILIFVKNFYDRFISKRYSEYSKFIFYLNIEEIGFSFFATLWIFGILPISVATIFWMVAFLAFIFIFKTNYEIKFLPSDKQYIINKILLKKKITFLNVREVKHNVLKEYYKNPHSNKIKKQNTKKLFYALNVYTSSLMIAALILLFKNGGMQNQYDVLIKNILILSACLYPIHKIAYFICVDNEVSLWFGSKKFFNIVFGFISFVFYVIVAYITLYGG